MAVHHRQAALEIASDHRATRAARCILFGLTGNCRLAIEDAVALQGSSSTARVFKSLEGAREAALGATTKGASGGSGGVVSPSVGPRAAVRLFQTITAIQEGAK